MTREIFGITAKELDTIEKWKKKHERKCKVGPTTIGGRYTYCFKPTSVGVIGIVKCVCGKEKDFTNYDEL